MSLEDALQMLRVQIQSRIDRFCNLLETLPVDAFILPESSDEATRYLDTFRGEEWQPRDVQAGDMWTNKLSHVELSSQGEQERNPGLKAMSHREFDAYLKAKDKHSMPANLSQDKDRCSAAGSPASPCVTRFCRIFLQDRLRFALGKELLRFQLPLPKDIEQQIWQAFADAKLLELAGNAFNAQSAITILFTLIASLASIAY